MPGFDISQITKNVNLNNTKTYKVITLNDKTGEHDWNQHPITAKCLKDLKSRIPVLNAKNVLQCSIVLDNLRIIDSEAW